MNANVKVPRNDIADIQRPCKECSMQMLPHCREDTPEGTICNSCLGKKFKANRDQETIMGVKNPYYGTTEESKLGSFNFSVQGGTGAQRAG